MTTLDAVIEAAGWQGGTIHRAIEHCRKHGKVGTSAYRLGLREGLDIQKPGTIEYDPQGTVTTTNIPVNSFGSPESQTPDFVLGLINSGLPV